MRLILKKWENSVAKVGLRGHFRLHFTSSSIVFLPARNFALLFSTALIHDASS
jgi:hypothetical protein